MQWGARSLGAAIAREFANRNTHLAGGDRDEAASAPAVESINGTGGGAFGIRCAGTIDTPLQEAIRESDSNPISGVPMERFPGPAAPAEVAALIVSGGADVLAIRIVGLRDRAVMQGMGWGN